MIQIVYFSLKIKKWNCTLCAQCVVLHGSVSVGLFEAKIYFDIINNTDDDDDDSQ